MQTGLVIFPTKNFYWNLYVIFFARHTSTDNNNTLLTGSSASLIKALHIVHICMQRTEMLIYNTTLFWAQIWPRWMNWLHTLSFKLARVWTGDLWIANRIIFLDWHIHRTLSFIVTSPASRSSQLSFILIAHAWCLSQLSYMPITHAWCSSHLSYMPIAHAWCSSKLSYCSLHAPVSGWNWVSLMPKYAMKTAAIFID